MQPGTRFGPYEIVAPLGAGGMGEVYRARDTRLGREVAIKILPEGFAADPDRRRRFEQEARATAALDHPNIMAIYDIGAHEGCPYLVEQLLDGVSLRERLRDGPLPCRSAVEIAAHIAHGLAAAHDKGIVHRDLKPENVFITGDGTVKILDFGLAKLARELEDVDLTAQLTASAPHAVLGTAAYMAPEQARGQVVDHRADIFALGVVLYEMLSGRSPFRRETAVDTVGAVLSAEPPPLATGAPPCPAPLDALVRRCLEKRPDDRFSSARDVAYALAAFGTPAGAPSAGQAASPAGPADDRPSIAVLPFANLSADPEQEYFCDGMAEEILNALAHVPGLRVIARTSAFAFKGRSQDIREIGSRLDVGTLLEGSVRKAGDRLRITAQLIRVADGSHIWSERYDRRLEDVFAIQDEIALAIVESLRLHLLGREKAAITSHATENLDAHSAYLRGLFEWNTMSAEGIARARELYSEALRLDPAYALAYARLADATGSATWWADQPPVEAMAQALRLTESALNLAPDLALAHSTRGHILAFLRRDWAAGETLMRKAVELAPSDAYAQVYLSLYLTVKGDHQEAAERARLAQRLDPLSPAINSWAASCLTCTGHLDEALASLTRQIAMTPHLWMPHFFLAHALAVGGRLDEARLAADTACALSGGISLTLSFQATVGYLAGDRETGDKLFDRLRHRAGERYVSPMLLAWLHVLRGETDAAIGCVEDALRACDPWVSTHRMYSPSIVPAESRVDAVLAQVLPR